MSDSDLTARQTDRNVRPRTGRAHQYRDLTQVAVLALAFALLSACSSSSSKDASAKPATAPTVGSDNGQSEIHREQVCSDPKWKTNHLGLWYSLCPASIAR